MKEEYWNILDKTTDWIKTSDTKASVILTVYGILITFFYSNSSEVYTSISQSWLLIGVTAIAGIFSLFSVGYCFKALNPRLKNDNPTSLIYFGHIQKKYSNAQEYHKELSEALNDEDRFERQLSDLIYVNSQIAWAKFKNIAISIRFFAAFLGVLILDLILFLLVI